MSVCIGGPLFHFRMKTIFVILAVSVSLTVIMECVEKSGVGMRCLLNTECRSGKCGKRRELTIQGKRLLAGTCVLKTMGEECSDDAQCKSAKCRKTTGGVKACKPSLKMNGEACEEDAQCKSGKCRKTHDKDDKKKRRCRSQ